MHEASTIRSEIHGHARFVAKAGKERQLEEELLAVTLQTREEPGNLFVDLFRSRDQPSIFYVSSAWRDDAALASHFEQPYVQAFLASAGTLQAETSSVGFGLMVSDPVS